MRPVYYPWIIQSKFFSSDSGDYRGGIWGPGSPGSFPVIKTNLPLYSEVPARAASQFEDQDHGDRHARPLRVRWATFL